MQDPLQTPSLEPRASQVLGAINSWNAGLSPADRRVKYCKMASVPLVFYRGTNHLFWADFVEDPRLDNFGGAQTETWIQGDLHAYNFGSFHDARGRVVYDLNDFDEAVVADYQYDVWRMAVSLVLIARQNRHLRPGEQASAVDAFTEAYFDALTSYRGSSKAARVSWTSKNTRGRLDAFLRQVEADYHRGGMLDRWAPKTGKGRRFDLGRSKLGEVSARERETIVAAMKKYRGTLAGSPAKKKSHFKVLDVARRLLAGTGSLGTPRYYVLIEGGKRGRRRDDRILDVKLQSPPTAQAFLGAARGRSGGAFRHEAHRHAEGYRALIRRADGHLGWMELGDGFYSVRERSPYKEAFPAEKLNTAARFAKLAAQWGEILAAGHARANGDLAQQVDTRIEGHRRELRDLVRDLAFGYAFQVESDWRCFVEALSPSIFECADHAFTIPQFRGLLPG